MSTTEYRRNYYREYARRHMAEAHEILGGKCAVCGRTDDLEVDHIDPTTKLFTIANGWTKPREQWLAEIAKCQLLCKEHHHEKSTRERGQQPARGTHGTVSAYRYCGPPKCEACKEAKRNAPSARNRQAGARPL